MQRYTLRYEGPESNRPETVEFRAVSLESALEMAKRHSVGTWAELLEEGVPVCRMQLLDSAGLWRISGVNSPG